MDRNRFKGASLNSIKEEQGRAKKSLPSLSSDGRPGFHEIVEGRNWRRIAPAHNPDETPYRAKSTVTLDVEVPVYDDDGNETGRSEVRRKPIFIATQHSKSMKDCPILLYINYVFKRANDEIQDKNERAKFLYPINGWRSRDGKWNWGIRPDIKYVCYAWDENGKLGREELFQSMLDDMKKESIKNSDASMEIIPDIFSDPDEGFPLVINKVKNEKGKWDWIISAEQLGRGETWAEFFKRTRVTDEQLAELSSKESLKDLYEDSYTIRDFDYAVNGLQRFDQQHKYGIFENEEFLNALSELRNQAPDYGSNDSQGTSENKPDVTEKGVASQVKESHVVKEQEEKAPVKSLPASVPIPKMKNEIKSYILENYGDDYSMPDLDKEDLKRWYDLCKIGEELPFDDYSDTPKQASITKADENPSEASKETAKEPAKESKIEEEPASEEVEMDPEIKAQIEKLRARRRG